MIDDSAAVVSSVRAAACVHHWLLSVEVGEEVLVVLELIKWMLLHLWVDIHMINQLLIVSLEVPTDVK